MRLLLCLLALSSPAYAQLSASATFTSSQVNATTYHYDLVLKNTGTTNVGTFWFSWVPGVDYMPSSPANVKSATGWSATITHAGVGDGYAILWQGGPLAAGQTLAGFGFDSAIAPAQMTGLNVTAYVYSGAPFSDTGFNFSVTSAPAATLSASATVTPSPLTPSTYHYDIVLKNTGTTNVGTFWFAWIPGSDFMPSAPSNIKSPTSWTATVTHAAAPDGYAIQWAGGPLAAGQTLAGFSFDSSVTPSQLAANDTSFVYIGAPLSDPGFSFSPTVSNVATTPSPTGVTPAFGATTQNYTFTFSDTGGFANLKLVDILINNVLDGRVACYIAFIPSGANSGTLDLVDNAGDAGGPFASMSLPGSGSVSNGQCTITAAGAVISGNGNTLSLTLPITFTASFAGNKIIYMSAQNATANSGWSAMGTVNNPASGLTGPTVTGMSPGHTTVATQTYVFTFNDTNGWQDIAVADVLVNSAINGIGACYIAYVPTGATTGSVFLVDNAGDAGGPFVGGFLLPGSGTAANSQCTVSATGSSASGSGNTLTLTLAITFNHSFTGNQVFFLSDRNNAGANSGWQSAGTVAVP